MSKGDTAERELSNTLEDKYGYAAMRSPGSGSRTKRNRPDVFGVKQTQIQPENPGLNRRVLDAVAVEVKASSGGTYTFPEREITGLVEFAGRAGADALVAVKPDLRSHSQWYVYHVGDLPVTAGGYSVRKQDHSRGKTIDEVFG